VLIHVLSTARFQTSASFKQLISATELGNQPVIEGERNKDSNSISAWLSLSLAVAVEQH
jgi:hypothetical protein